MKKDQNLKCRQESHESFSAFTMVDIESSKEVKGCKRLRKHENKWLNGFNDRWTDEKKKELWSATHKSMNSKTRPFC